MGHETQPQDCDGFAAVLAEYLTRIDRGETVCRETFLAEHAGHAAALCEYFDDVDLVEGLSTAFQRGVSTSPSRPLGEFGDYELLSEMGRGGMGIVYRAREYATGRLVALKMLLHVLFLSPAELQRFRNEATTATGLVHRNIVPIYTVGEHERHLFYTMPILEGGNLAQRLVTGPLVPRRGAELLVAIAEAVEFAHSRGVIHRDLKPANILLDEHEKPYVADFGLARQLEEDRLGITRTGELLGTPNYMAPEQVIGPRAAIGPAVDVYAMGAILYAMLVGRPPFQCESIPATLQKISSTDPLPPRQINDLVPRDLETICLKCLEKSPSNRYGSAADLAIDLRRYLADERLVARPVSHLERGRRWFARNPIIGTLAVGITLALIAGTSFSLYYARQAGRREQQATANLYAADMNLAQQHVRSGAVASALRLLERHRIKPGAVGGQGWEWRHLWHQCHAELRRFEGPRGAVNAAAFSPNGLNVAASGDDHTIWIWDTATGKVLKRLVGHRRAVHGLSFAPDGGQLVTVGDDGLGFVWDVASSKRVATLSGHERPLTTVSLSRDGRFIATAGKDEAKVNIWDAASHALLQSLDLGPTECVALSPVGAQLAIASNDGKIRVCRLGENGKWKIANTILAHADVVHSLAWSPDGTRLATAGADHEVNLWDTESWGKIATIDGFTESVYSVAFRPDGRQLAVAARNEPLKIWDLDRQESVAELVGHSELINSVAYCPDGWRLVSASKDGTVRLWDAIKATHHDRLEGSPSGVRAIDFSPDGTTLASIDADDCAIILWDVALPQPRQVLRSLPAGITDVRFSPTGRYLASVSGPHLHIWNLATHELVVDVEFAEERLAGIAWMPSGDRIAVQAEAGRISILAADSGKQLAAWQATQRPHGGIAFSPDGRLLVTTSVDHIVRVWDVATQSIRYELAGHTAPVISVAFNRQGSLIASSSNDHTIRLWDGTTGHHLRTLIGHAGTPYGLAFNQNSTRLASGSTDRSVKLWDVAEGLELQSLVGHHNWVLDVAFGPDEQVLASGGADGSIRIWHAPNKGVGSSTGREAAALVTHLTHFATARLPAQTPADRDAIVRKLQERIESDHSISEFARAAAIARIDGYLLYWAPMCDGTRAAKRHDWPAAIDAFERATSLAPDNIMLWHWLAVSSAANRHLDVYERACGELFRRFSGSANQYDLGPIVSTSLILPRNGTDLAHLRPLVDAFAHQSDIGGDVYYLLYELRTGGMPSRLRQLVESLRFARPPRPEECFIMAMAWAKIGDDQRARAEFEAGSHLARLIPPTKWVGDVYCETLQREAEEVLRLKLAAEKSLTHAESPFQAIPSGESPPNARRLAAPATSAQ